MQRRGKFFLGEERFDILSGREKVFFLQLKVFLLPREENFLQGKDMIFFDKKRPESFGVGGGVRRGQEFLLLRRVFCF